MRSTLSHYFPIAPLRVLGVLIACAPSVVQGNPLVAPTGLGDSHNTLPTPTPWLPIWEIGGITTPFNDDGLGDGATANGIEFTFSKNITYHGQPAKLIGKGECEPVHLVCVANTTLVVENIVAYTAPFLVEKTMTSWSTQYATATKTISKTSLTVSPDKPTGTTLRTGPTVCHATPMIDGVPTHISFPINIATPTNSATVPGQVHPGTITTANISAAFPSLPNNPTGDVSSDATPVDTTPKTFNLLV